MRLTLCKWLNDNPFTGVLMVQNLAKCFGLTGLAAVGFPGTFGDIGMEILMDRVVVANPFLGAAVVIFAAMIGISIVQVLLRLFTGSNDNSSVSLKFRVREQYGVHALAALILIDVIYRQGRVASRYDAAVQLLQIQSEHEYDVAIHRR